MRLSTAAAAVPSPLDAEPIPAAQRLRRAQWTVLLASMFCYLFYYTGRQTFGFAIPGIQAELGISKTTLGWISAGLLWAYAVGQAINGNLGDKFGGRRLVSLGAILSCVMNWIVSFGHSPLTIAVPWGANGYVQALGWAPGSRVISNWWAHRERGKAYGLYVFAAGMASVVAFCTSLLIVTLHLDWRWIFRLPVLLMLLGGVAYYVLVRDRPEDRGFPPITNDEATEDEKLKKIDQKQPETQETSWQRYRDVLTSWRFLIASLAIGFQSIARYGLLIWVPVYFLGANWKDNPAGVWISVSLPVGMAFGALSSGWLSDKLFASNRSRPIMLFLWLAAISSAGMWWLPHGHLAGIPLLFLCGFFAYGPQSAFWALCPDLLGHRRAGTGTGVMNTFAYLFAGLGEPYIGHMIESNGNDASLVFPIVASSCVVGAIIAMFIRR